MRDVEHLFMYLLAIHMSSLENSWVFFKLSLNISASFTNLQRFFKKYLLIYLAAPGLSCSMWDLVPWPGIEPGPPALGAERVNHRTSREVPAEIFFKPKVLFCTYSVHCIYLLSYFFPSIQHSISTFFPAPTGILLVMRIHTAWSLETLFEIFKKTRLTKLMLLMILMNC